MKNRHAFNTVISAMLISVSLTVGAATIYKSQLDDGSILYSQKRTGNGKLLKTIDVPSQTPQEVAARRAAERDLQQQIARADRLSEQRAKQLARTEVYVHMDMPAFLPAYSAFNYVRSPLRGNRYVPASGGSRLTDIHRTHMIPFGIWDYPLLELLEPAPPHMLLAR
jgi:hypothetical protein